jgi:hypothetical protein
MPAGLRSATNKRFAEKITLAEIGPNATFRGWTVLLLSLRTAFFSALFKAPDPVGTGGGRNLPRLGLECKRCVTAV